MKRSVVIGVGVCLMAATGWSLTMSNVDGGWSSPVGGVSINYYDAVAVAYGNEDQDQIRWGTPAAQAQSGLGFTGIVDPGTAAMTFGIGETFEIGQLQHFNQPIYGGTAISAVDLLLTLDFSDPTGLSGAFNFKVKVNETPNDPPPGDDIISFPSVFPTETVDIGGTMYTLELLGFGDAPDALMNEFISPEGGTSSTKMWGRITSDIPSVPDGGSTLLLLVTALTSLLAVKRAKA